MAEVIYVGNAAANTADRGWMLGHFMEADDARRSDDVEIKWGIHPLDEKRREWAPDDGRTTLSVLVSGRFRIDLPDRGVLLAEQGDYVLFRGVGHTWHAEEASVVIVIRWPSVSPPESAGGDGENLRLQLGGRRDWVLLAALWATGNTQSWHRGAGNRA